LLKDDDPDPYFVNEEAVGPNCPNRRDDVLLVQFFLRALSDRDNRYRPEKAKDLSVTGIYTADTTAYAKAYVAEGNRQKAALQPVSDDGRVDSPVKTGSLFSPSSQMIYVILRMNLDYKRAWPKRRLTSSPNFPKELKANFYIK
jgi:hypothetical protein